jgi:hypothetical protein
LEGDANRNVGTPLFDLLERSRADSRAAGEVTD